MESQKKKGKERVVSGEGGRVDDMIEWGKGRGWNLKSHNGFGMGCLRPNILLRYSFHLETVTDTSSFTFLRLTRKLQHSEGILITF